jgi:hypothetical protein
MSASEPLGGEPLIVCSVCESVINKTNAQKRTIEGPKGPVSVWICKICLRLGSEEAVKKYIMKQEKRVTALGR